MNKREFIEAIESSCVSDDSEVFVIDLNGDEHAITGVRVHKGVTEYCLEISYERPYYEKPTKEELVKMIMNKGDK